MSLAQELGRIQHTPVSTVGMTEQPPGGSASIAQIASLVVHTGSLTELQLTVLAVVTLEQIPGALLFCPFNFKRHES